MIGTLFLGIENPWGLLPLGTLLWMAIWRRRSARTLAQERSLLDAEEGAHHWPKRRRRAEMLLLSIALLASSAGLSGLRWGLEPSGVRWRGCDFWLLLDTSLSMRALDGGPQGGGGASRLEWAESLCSRFFEDFPGARFGIVPFAGEASVLLLPSTDRNEFWYYLGGAASVPKSRGTDLLEPLGTLADEWKESPPAGPVPVAVLISDGGREEGRELPIARIGEAAKEVQSVSPRVLFVCVAVGGDRSAMIPRETSTGEALFEEEEGSAGSLRTARFDPPLERISEVTGGLFFRAKETTAEAICRTVAQRLRDRGVHPERAAAAASRGSPSGRAWAWVGLGALLLLTTLWSRQ